MQTQLPEDYDVREIAQETMIGDLTSAILDELKAMPEVWQKLSEAKQAEVIERASARVVHNVTQAIHILASQDRPTIRASLEQITVKNGVKAVLALSKKDPAFHDLADATGEEILVVLPHIEEYAGQDPGVKADPDQRGLDGLDEDQGSGGYAPAGPHSIKSEGGVLTLDREPLERLDKLLPEAIQEVVFSQRASISSVQRKLKIGYSRAAILVDEMEKLGVISPANSNGVRKVLIQVDEEGDS